MEKNARIKTGTRSKTGSARTSTGILLIWVPTYVRSEYLSIVDVEKNHRFMSVNNAKLEAWWGETKVAGMQHAAMMSQKSDTAHPFFPRRRDGDDDGGGAERPSHRKKCGRS
jgi:hypothetical protein